MEAGIRLDWVPVCCFSELLVPNFVEGIAGCCVMFFLDNVVSTDSIGSSFAAAGFRPGLPAGGVWLLAGDG